MENLEVINQPELNLDATDLARVQNLKSLTGETTNTQTIKTALELAEIVIKNMKSGNQIAIEHPDNMKEYIRIT